MDEVMQVISFLLSAVQEKNRRLAEQEAQIRVLSQQIQSQTNVKQPEVPPPAEPVADTSKKSVVKH